ncbi:polyprenyl synthetase family protein [Candidatus Micrarchaeota archaeon]|nr:polyprenyl synthetase family protein [Candidatus Micrarchaeota archaeon]MBU1930758.1 polyprenyl synthetase family protein [Candidatus Micrarchaeota archaeon]
MGEKILELAKNSIDPAYLKELYFVLERGKRARPVLMQKICGKLGVKEDPLEEAQTAVELIHSASLIHDDFVDDDRERRGKKSFFAAFGKNKGVLFGDYCFAASLKILIHHQYPKKIIDSAVNAVFEMVESQLDLENHKVKDLDSYLKYATGKTARLFELCAIIPMEYYKVESKVAKEFAKLYGLVFQLVDDLSEQKPEEANIKNFLSLAEAKQFVQKKIQELESFNFIPLSELPFILPIESFLKGNAVASH